MKGITWSVKREWRAFYAFLCENLEFIPIKKSLIPIVLPILVLASIHTYMRIQSPEVGVEKSSLPSLSSALNKEDSIHTVNMNTMISSYSGDGISQDEDTSAESDKGAYAYNAADGRLEKPPDMRIRVRTHPSSDLKKIVVPDITRGDLMRKELSITFDGGSEATDTEEILKTLRERSIKTTIFLTGEFIKRYPELVKTMVEDGHEIGNHSMNHPHLTTFEKNFRQQTLSGVDKNFITSQLKETAKIFKDLTGKDMAPYWRAPYGEQNAEIRRWAYEAGFTHIGWTMDNKTRESLDTLDWVVNEESEFYHSASEIKERILNFGKDGNGVNGGIVLMHLGTERKDSHAYTKLPEIIDSLEQRGYRIVKVSELLEVKR